jgi:bifunctional non-homologous end joining protein LigD
MHVGDAAQARRLAGQVPVVYLVFDILHLDGRSTVELPYTDRRQLLEDLELSGPAWQIPPFFRGGGADVLRASQEQGLEGVVAKRLDSPYRPGRRSGQWRKVKNVRTQTVVIGGWKPGEGRRAATIGSLLLGVQEDGGLVFAGHVGTGFSDRVLDELTGRLRRLERKTSPFATEVPREHARHAHWVTPTLVGEVGFGEWTRDGRMRHPSWRGLRTDVAPEDVVRES